MSQPNTTGFQPCLDSASLSLKERSLLLLAQGLQGSQLQQLYHGQAKRWLQSLAERGYLQSSQPPPEIPEISLEAGD